MYTNKLFTVTISKLCLFTFIRHYWIWWGAWLWQYRGGRWKQWDPQLSPKPRVVSSTKLLIYIEKIKSYHHGWDINSICMEAMLHLYIRIWYSVGLLFIYITYTTMKREESSCTIKPFYYKLKLILFYRRYWADLHRGFYTAALT